MIASFSYQGCAKVESSLNTDQLSVVVKELNAFFGNRCSQILFDGIQRYNGILKRINLH